MQFDVYGWFMVLAAIHAQLRATSARVQLNRTLLQCMRGSTSQCHITATQLGPYRITHGYYQDATHPTEGNPSLTTKGQSIKNLWGVGSENYSIQVIQAYMDRYAEDELGRPPTDEEIVRIHVGGPLGFMGEQATTYWNEVSGCLEDLAFGEEPEIDPGSSDECDPPCAAGQCCQEVEHSEEGSSDEESDHDYECFCIIQIASFFVEELCPLMTSTVSLFPSSTTQMLTYSSITPTSTLSPPHSLTTLYANGSQLSTRHEPSVTSSYSMPMGGISSTGEMLTSSEALPTDSSQSGGQSSTADTNTVIVATVVAGSALAIMVCLVAVFIYIKRKKQQMHKSMGMSECPMSARPTGKLTDWRTEGKAVENSVRYHDPPKLHPRESLVSVDIPPALLDLMDKNKMCIPGRSIQLVDTIGRGEFGVVYRAHLAGWSDKSVGNVVAVKTLRGSMFSSRDIESLAQESVKMVQFDHPNVLDLIGICIDSGEAPYLVMPYMANGNLLSYLRKERTNLTVDEGAAMELVEASQKQLLSMCLQIAQGMEYLAAMKFVHRDLAARNCMIDAEFRIKVADFGLSEDMYTRMYFRQGDEECAVKLPIKWMAIESLHDGIFTERTDVWSFGVTCWEIFSLGKTPYPGVDPFTLLKHLDAGHRLEKPPNAAISNQIYDVILQCWEGDPRDRPPFKVLVQHFTTFLEKVADYLVITNLTITNDEDMDHEMTTSDKDNGSGSKDVDSL